MRIRQLNLNFFFTGWIAGMVCCLTACKEHPVNPAPSQNVQGSLEDRGKKELFDPNQSSGWIRPRSNDRIQERKQMVDHIRQYYGLGESKILEVMQNVPRHWFVPSNQQAYAYDDSPLPIGEGQTISQPFIVAYMTHILMLDPNDRVLEIGTGSGYQAAVLNEFTPSVYTVEIIRSLGERAIDLFSSHRYNTISVKIGDGYKGWPEYAPFDAIIVTCAPENIPPPLLEQLKPSGKMIIPVGGRWGIQELVLVEKDMSNKTTRRSVMPVRFVPLIRQEE
jgi:protein-L-isoaspartate(D-aspartate) O-methyltransferase